MKLNKKNKKGEYKIDPNAPNTTSSDWIIMNDDDLEPHYYWSNNTGKSQLAGEYKKANEKDNSEDKVKELLEEYLKKEAETTLKKHVENFIIDNNKYIPSQSPNIPLDGYKYLKDGDFIKDGDMYFSLAAGWQKYKILTDEKITYTCGWFGKMIRKSERVNYSELEKNNILELLSNKRALNGDSAYKVENELILLCETLAEDKIIGSQRGVRFYLLDK